MQAPVLHVEDGHQPGEQVLAQNTCDAKLAQRLIVKGSDVEVVQLQLADVHLEHMGVAPDIGLLLSGAVKDPRSGVLGHGQLKPLRPANIDHGTVHTRVDDEGHALTGSHTDHEHRPESVLEVDNRGTNQLHPHVAQRSERSARTASRRQGQEQHAHRRRD
jgi:hypothetical protein